MDRWQDPVGTRSIHQRLRRSGVRPGATWLAILLVIGACSADPALSDPATSTTSSATTAVSTTSIVADESGRFPVARFAALGDEPVPDGLAAELQAVLDASANGHGMTATVISPLGTWNGATGLAAADRAMTPNDQMSIASITKTIVAAQVMQLVETGELALDDLAGDRLPTGLEFDTNGATIEDLLSMRSGIAEYFADEAELREVLFTDPLHVWTVDEKLATVAPERGPVGQEWLYTGTNYLLLGLIIEHVMGRPIAEVLRDGVLAGADYQRLIYQPDELPTAPMAMANGAPDAAFEENGGFLPSIANVSMFTSEGAMASDASSLARWFTALCGGQVVSPASVDEMTDFDQRPEYGLGIWDRRGEYGAGSGALGHTGLHREGYRTAALCFQTSGIVVVVLANSAEGVDVDTVAGLLVEAAGGVSD